MHKITLAALLPLSLAVIGCSGSPSVATGAAQSSTSGITEYTVVVRGCIEAAGKGRKIRDGVTAKLTLVNTNEVMYLTGEAVNGKLKGELSGVLVGKGAFVAQVNGRLSSRSGGGSWHLNDSCGGTWDAR